VAEGVGAERQFGPLLPPLLRRRPCRSEIGGAFVDPEGTIEMGYAVVESQSNRGYATEALKALVAKAPEASDVRRIVAHTPRERPESGRVLAKAGFALVREIEDADAAGERRARQGVGAGGLAPNRRSPPRRWRAPTFRDVTGG
jgi:hypothetical protein